VRAGGKGPPDVALRVDRVKIKGPLESDVCKYVPTKDPSDSDRYLMETDPSLEKQGWRLFAVDCRSKDSVKRACSWIMSNYAKTGSRGRHSLASWRKRLSNWNFDLFPQGNAKVALTMEWLTRMEDAWEKHDLASVAINLDR
jgi:hypothetical protein